MSQLDFFRPPTPAAVSGAVIDSSGKYRYRLWRIWEPTLPRCVFVMLNPSTADAEVDDPTIRRCLGFARRWGCGGLEVVNVFAWRATNPVWLARVDDPVGPDNDAAIGEAAKLGQPLVAAWGGTWGSLHGRDKAVLALLAGLDVMCLGRTRRGRPRHPLYVRADHALERFA